MTTARRAASPPGTSRWSTRRPTTPRRSCRWPRRVLGCACPTAPATCSRSAEPRRCTMPGGCTRAWCDGAWSAGSTRAGTCTPRSFRRGTRRRTPSSGKACPPPSPGCGPTWAAATAGCWTSRPPRAPWPASCAAASIAARSTSTRSTAVAFDLVLRSRRAVTPEGERPAAVAVRNGRIAELLPYDSPGEDLGELALLPGLVDTHVHVNEPGRTEWEGFASATRAAAAGGVTTIVDMPLNSIPPTTDVAALATKRAAAAGQCHVDVGFWGGAVPGNDGELAALHEAGVFGFKAFLIDSGVPEFPPLDVIGLGRAMRAVDALFVIHAEDPALVTAPV